MRLLAVVGLGLVCGCATSPAVDVGAQGVTSEPEVSIDATSSDVASSVPMSSFATSSEVTSEPETSSSVVVETSSPEATSASPVTSATSSEPTTEASGATSETSAQGSSAVTSDAISVEVNTEEPAPELTLENVVEELTAMGIDSDPLGGFRVYILPVGDQFLAGREDGEHPPFPLFDPPLVEWEPGCGELKALFRVPVGMCLKIGGNLKTVGQYPAASECEPDLAIPTCADAEERLTYSRPAGLEPDHTVKLEVRAFAYSPEQCAPEGVPSWRAVLFQGPCVDN